MLSRYGMRYCLTVFITCLAGCPFFDDQDEKDTVEKKLVMPEFDLFSRDRLATFKVNMQDSDWQTIRFEGKPLGVIAGACNRFTDYTQVRAKVEIDDTPIDDVQLRKKGGLGSLSFTRPSLKLDFGSGATNEGRQYQGQRRITLNNNHQDPSKVEQCIAYSIFQSAGIESPRCNLVTVDIQGQSKGVYTQVESIKKDFLLRAFGDDSGTLYEGESADFNEALIHRFEQKTNLENNDREDLESVRLALQASDDDVWQQLDLVIDMDQFLRFAAVEALIGHSDSYTGSQTNFYIYRRPSDDRFVFIPWGADQVFQTPRVSGFMPDNNSVFLRNEILARLWPLKSVRDQYDGVMTELLNTVWDEQWLDQEVDHWSSLAATDSLLLTTVRDFIQNRRSQIMAELGLDTRVANRLPDREVDQAEREDCLELTPFELNFTGETSGAGEDDFNASFRFQYQLGNTLIDLTETADPFESGIRTELDQSKTEQPRDVIFIRFWVVEGSNTYWVTMVLPPEVFTPGTHPLHAYDLFGVFGNDIDGFLGFIGDGELILNQASLEAGAPLEGSVSAKLIAL